MSAVGKIGMVGNGPGQFSWVLKRNQFEFRPSQRYLLARLDLNPCTSYLWGLWLHRWSRNSCCLTRILVWFAFITGNSRLDLLLDGLLSQIHMDLSKRKRTSTHVQETASNNWMQIHLFWSKESCSLYFDYQTDYIFADGARVKKEVVLVNFQWIPFKAINWMFTILLTPVTYQWLSWVFATRTKT